MSDHKSKAIRALAGLARLGGGVLEAWECRHDPPCDPAEEQCERCEQGERDHDLMMHHVTTLKGIIDTEPARMAQARREALEEAAKMMCPGCRAGRPLVLVERGWVHQEGPHHNVGWSQCHANPIHDMLYEEAPDAG